MIFSRGQRYKHRRFEYQPRYASKKKEERIISFREQHIFDTTDLHLAGKMREYTHVKNPKNSVAARYTRLFLLLAISGVVYFIYSDKFQLGDDLTKTMIGCFMLIILLVLFINKSNKG